RGESGIIYCFSQKSTESLANKLQKVGLRALPYHAGMDPARRAETQEGFIKNDIDIVVATIAFGMGIDKPDIRFVIHYDLPKNMETYSQETGRAGRDGLRSDCILFFGYGDTKKIEYLIGQGNDEEQKRISYVKLQDMVNFCDSHECRRRALLGYFGEAYEEDNCGSCDNCCQAPRRDLTGRRWPRRF
ncbi:MAG TPA: RecQ family ATP-dependent DNA helicase, partial [Methanotrichaceae archaeon]|nr:RecQ family ATP-dependent DNA helicase [Methanotrichaceae archaeon]